MGRPATAKGNASKLGPERQVKFQPFNAEKCFCFEMHEIAMKRSGRRLATSCLSRLGRMSHWRAECLTSDKDDSVPPSHISGKRRAPGWAGPASGTAAIRLAPVDNATMRGWLLAPALPPGFSPRAAGKEKALSPDTRVAGPLEGRPRCEGVAPNLSAHPVANVAGVLRAQQKNSLAGRWARRV